MKNVKYENYRNLTEQQVNKCYWNASRLLDAELHKPSVC